MTARRCQDKSEYSGNDSAMPMRGKSTTCRRVSFFLLRSLTALFGGLRPPNILKLLPGKS